MIGEGDEIMGSRLDFIVGPDEDEHCCRSQ